MTPARRSRLAGLVAVALAAAAGLVGLSASAASAALCSGSGVNVVVDFHGLGGGVQNGCDSNGANRMAKEVFPAAGFPLRYAQRQPGFVCRVKDAPQSDPCLNTSPADATWGLYWSDGKSGKWSYANTGVGGLKVPDGGFLAFSWQNGGPADPPRASPTNKTSSPSKTPVPKPAPKPAPKPTKAATAKPTRAATSTPTGTSTGTSTGAARQKAAASSVPTAPARTKATAKGGAGASPSTSESSSPLTSTTLEPSPDASPGALSADKVSSDFAPAEDHSALPTWIPIVVIAGLALTAVGGIWWRNRSGTA